MEALKKAVRHVSLRGEITWPSGQTQALTGEDILSLSISEGVNDGLLLGACPAAGLRLTLSDPQGQFLYLGEKRGANAAAGAQVKLHLRVMDSSGAWQETPLGHFFVTDMTGQENAVGCVLQGVDALGYLFEGAIGDTLAYPASLADIAQMIARQAGMEVNTDFPGGQGMVSAPPDWGGMSLRRGLSCLCAAAGCFAHEDRQGKLCIKPVRDENSGSPYQIEAQNSLIRQYGEVSFGPLNALRIATCDAPAEAQDGVLLLTEDTGVSESTLYTLQGNPLFAYGAAHIQSLGAQALENLRGLSMTRALLKWQGDPEVTLGRCVCMTDKRNVPTYTVVTRQTLQFDQGFSMHTDCTVRTPFAQGAGIVISPNGQISGGSISGEISGALIKNGTLGVTALTAHSITGRYIAANAVEAGHLSAGSVQSAHIEAGAVNAGHIESKSITAEQLASGIITADSGLIAQGAIGAAQIADGSITDAKIVDLTANKITAGTLDGENVNVINLRADNITTGTLNGMVIPQLGEDKIQDGAVSGVKIQENAITADKIVSGAVTAEKIAAESVSANHILSGAVTADKLSAHAVTADKIVAGSVTVNHLAADVGGSLDLSSNASVKTLVDSVQIGGVNLLADSERERAVSGGRFLAVHVRDALADHVGDKIVVSFEAMGNKADWMNVYAYQYSGISIGAEFGFTMPTDDFKRFSFVTTAVDYTDKSGLSTGEIAFYDSVDTQNFTIRKIQIERGDRATDYAPSPADSAASISALEARVQSAEEKITLDAIVNTVRSSESYIGDLAGKLGAEEAAKSVVTHSGSTRLTDDSFQVSFDGQDVMHISPERADFDVSTMQVTGQILGNVPNTQEAITVAVPSGASIQTALDSLGKNLLGNVEVRIAGYHAENVQVKGFFGPGVLTLRFLSGAVLEGTLYASDCTCKLNLYGSSMTDRVIRGSAYGVQISNCSYVYLSTIGILGAERTTLGVNAGTYGVGVMEGSYVQARNVLIEKCGRCFTVSRSTLGIHNCVGGMDSTDPASVANNRWVVLEPQSNALVVVANGTIPHSTNGVYQEDGVLHYTASKAIATVSPDMAAEVSNQSVTMTPGGAQSAVYQTADGMGGYVKPWGYYTSVYQGKNQSAGGYMFGLWLFAEDYAAFYNTISGKTIQSVTVTIRRANAYGVDGSTVHLFYHGLLSVSDDQRPGDILTDTGLSTQVDRGKSVTFTLDSNLIAKLQDGTIKGFGLSSAGSTQLMQFDASVCDVTAVF